MLKHGGSLQEQLDLATRTIRQQRSTIDGLLSRVDEPIAVIGIGLRFPGGNDTLDGFADFLRVGGSGITALPTERWNGATSGHGVPGEPNAIRTRAGGFLDHIDRFDAQFFNIAPKHAQYIDPQQRMLLETTWTALEHANLDPTALRHGNGGVYVGATPFDYALELEALPYSELDGNLATGIGGYPMCGRLSYFLGWRGPSLNTDTACASSLTALHLAVEGLRARECEIAVCGAVNALHHRRIFAILSNGQVLAPDGHCKTFDDAADGYARAEGCGVLVLKRLSTARTDGDTIHALIRGTAIGQDGESAGLTAPNGAAQQEAMRTVLRKTMLEPGDIQYVEAHGTGTSLGDPLELSSINAVFSTAHSETDRLTVGSVKANIGHMEPVAGIGGLIKVILQLRERVFFPHRYLTPSTRVPWDTYPITVPTTCQPWVAEQRRAMVNSFGLAGAIGVAVLEQPPDEPAEQGNTPERSTDGWSVFTLSARSRPALALQIERYQRYVAEHPETPVADICYTRNVGRAHFQHRIAGMVRNTGELVALLDREAAAVTGEPRSQADARKTRKIALLFTGSASQYPGMGAGAYRRFPMFRQCVDDCDELFTPHLGRSVRALILGSDPDSAALLRDTVPAHAALFTLEYSLARLLMSWGVRPNVLIGHSVGEIIAATVAGLFPLPDGVAFLAARARLIESVSVRGGMAAVSAPADRVAPVLADWPLLSIAAINSPAQCVISGEADALARVVTILRDRGETVTPLNVSTAFHSPLMEEVAEPLGDVVAGLHFSEPAMTLVSNLTGGVIAFAELSTPDYWVRHLCSAVDFEAGLRTVAARGRHVMIEVGPSAALISLARQCIPDDGQLMVSCLRPGEDAGEALGRSLATLYTAGLTPHWDQVHVGGPGRKIALPTYVFDRKRYWLPINEDRHTTSGQGEQGGHSLLGTRVTPDTDLVRNEFVSQLSAGNPAYLADHTVMGKTFLPATAYVEMVLAVCDVVRGDTHARITDLRFDEALFLTERPTEVRTRAEVAANGDIEVTVVSRSLGADGTVERRHASGRIGQAAPYLTPSRAGAALRRRADQPGLPSRQLTRAQVYAAYERVGLDYGSRFRRVDWVTRHGDDLAISEMSGRNIATGEYAPPPVLDSATHGLAILADDGRHYVAVGIAEVRAFRKPRAARLRSVLQMRRQSGADGVAFTIDVLLQEDTEPIAELRGMAFRQLTSMIHDQASPGSGDHSGSTGAHPVTPPDRAALLAASRTSRVASIRDLIRNLVAELLHIEDAASIDAHATFLELGLDSLVGLRMKAALEATLEVQLAESVAFDHGSPAGLADFLDRQLVAEPANR
jgi:acyl transferase domain-containing protein